MDETITSILRQKYRRYEIIVKDGGSTDGSVERLPETEQIRFICQKDTGIYDAMNQALDYADGDYYLFLNTGDSFYDENVLEGVAGQITQMEKENGKRPDIVYGNLYHKALQDVIFASPVINDFTCYRNVPCHQSCFYHRSMFEERGYRPEFNVRADYEHFLWCYYKRKADIRYMPMLTASYEGGGYSETSENRKRSARQHKEIVVYYMGKKKVFYYRMIMLLTLAPLRSRMARSAVFSKWYHAVKRMIYQLKRMK